MVGLAEIQAYASLCACACATIVGGSLSSIKPTRGCHKDEDGLDDEQTEKLTMEDALLFPIIASIALLSLFLAFKYLSPEILQRLLAGYFLIMTTGAFWRMFSKAGHAALSSRYKFAKYHLHLTQEKEELLDFGFTKVEVSAGFAALAMAVAQGFYSHWIIVNLSALALGFNAISLLLLDSFRTASATLVGLFFYDCWWVFGTNVMITVATKIDGPIKIQWPRSADAVPSAMMLLGLGDIVIPGLFIAFCARYDYALAILSAPKADPPLPKHIKKRPYLIVSMIGYVTGLVATFAALHITKHPQPALLFLSPSCILSVTLLALARGDFAHLWRYTEDAGEKTLAKKEVKAAKDEDRLLLTEESSQAEIDAVISTPGPRTRQRTRSQSRPRKME